MINSNSLKKGTPIKLKNGWAAVIMDNRKGDTRMAEVDGLVKEIGSIYARDIDTAFVDGKWQPVKRVKPKKRFNLYDYTGGTGYLGDDVWVNTNGDFIGD
jgi:hypothetical protein